jgi:hypothetical protein
MRQHAQHVAELPIGRIAAAELGRNGGREDIPCLQLGEILGDERVGRIMGRSARGKPRPELLHQVGPIDSLRMGDHTGCECRGCHRASPLSGPSTIIGTSDVAPP